MNPVEFILGKRPEHYHGGFGDDGCFRTCPTWEYDTQALKIQFELVTCRMDELARTPRNPTKTGRMARLTRRQAVLDEQIKAMVSAQ